MFITIKACLAYTVVATLAACANAHAIHFDHLDKRESPSPLRIVLTPANLTTVNFAVTNTGTESLSLLTKGTILDGEDPVEKVHVYLGKKKIDFEGIRLRLYMDGLTLDDYEDLAAGQTKNFNVDAADLHNLQGGGNFSMVMEGSIPFAEAGGTLPIGRVHYESNTIVLKVDANNRTTVAPTFARRFAKRTSIGGSCQGAELATMKTALQNCVTSARAAAQDALTGSRISEFFMSNSTTTRETVAARLNAVADDCASSKATTTTNCDDQFNACAPGVLAYTVPSTSYITYCPIFHSELPPLTTTCGGQDQATTVLHEETHANSVFHPGCDDLGYGMKAAMKLTADQALNNADTFALFASAVDLKCPQPASPAGTSQAPSAQPPTPSIAQPSAYTPSAATPQPPATSQSTLSALPTIPPQATDVEAPPPTTLVPRPTRTPRPPPPSIITVTRTIHAAEASTATDRSWGSLGSLGSWGSWSITSNE